MSSLRIVTFQEALEIVESLPDNQQEDLIDILHSRRTERRREQLAERIKEGREEYAKGEITHGSVEDLLKEISA